MEVDCPKFDDVPNCPKFVLVIIPKGGNVLSCVSDVFTLGISAYLRYFLLFELASYCIICLLGKRPGGATLIVLLTGLCSQHGELIFKVLWVYLQSAH